MSLPSLDLPSALKGLRLDRKTPAHRRAAYAGFKIEELRVRESFWGNDSYSLELPFQCVCGRLEIFHRELPTPVSGKPLGDMLLYDPVFSLDKSTGDLLWDGVLELERLGSFSEEHLRKDGYSEEAIKEIRYIYDIEDELKTLRRGEQILRLRLSQYEHIPMEVAL